VMSTASNTSLKQSCSVLTSVTSALEVIFNVMRSINPRFTYLLYLLTCACDADCLAFQLASLDTDSTIHLWVSDCASAYLTVKWFALLF